MDATHSGFFSELVAQYQKGGWAMNLIALSLAVAGSIIIERIYRLFFQLNVDGNSLMFEVQKNILANDMEGALRLCHGAKQTGLARVIKAGLTRAQRSDDQIQNAIDAASLEMIPKIEKRLNYLALIANIATLLGLLGTITGLIRSFGALALADPGQRQIILANGISEAMNCTAFGLITAIITMVFHSILSAKAANLIEDIDEYGVKLLDLLSARKHSS